LIQQRRRRRKGRILFVAREVDIAFDLFKEHLVFKETASRRELSGLLHDPTTGYMRESDAAAL